MNLSEKQNNILRIARTNNLFVKILCDVLPKSESPPIKQGKRGNLVQLARNDVGFQYLLQHPEQKVRELCQARLASKSWPNHWKRLQSITAQAKARNGKLGIPLAYYRAHTGRWGGTENINLQNLPGRGRAGQGTHPLLQQIRNCLKAPKGYILGIVDLSQIEARVLAWFAGQHDLLEGFKNGEDVYSTFATTLFRSPVRKARDTDPPEIQQILKIRRGFGKDAILGAGFGMGAAKFYDRCLSNSDLKPAFDSGDFDYAFIKNLIETYRSTYFKIPEFWRNVEKAFRWVTKYPHEHIWYIDYIWGNRTNISKPIMLHFYNENKTTIIQLPSGRILRYPYTSINKKNEIQWRWGREWGGSLTENIIQASSRDLLGEAILNLEKNGFPVVMHLHDECVCLLPKNEAKEKLQQTIDTFCIVPEWAAELPINAEGKLSEHYKK